MELSVVELFTAFFFFFTSCPHVKGLCFQRFACHPWNESKKCVKMTARCATWSENTWFIVPFTKAMFNPLPTLFFTLLNNLWVSETVRLKQNTYFAQDFPTRAKIQSGKKNITVEDIKILECDPKEHGTCKKSVHAFSTPKETAQKEIRGDSVKQITSKWDNREQ